MSMDYVKSVYYPIRDETRKVTSYGQMNIWHDYKTPLNKQDRPRNKYIPDTEFIDPGVEIKVPTPEREKTFIQAERERSKLELLEKEKSNINTKLPFPKYLRPINSDSEPTIANGRIVQPDPMQMSALVHLGYSHSGGYDDYHKTYLKLKKEGVCPSYPLYGPPRLHHGRVGGSWKHVKQVLQAEGSRRVFVDGTPRWLENNKIMKNEVPGTDIMYPLSQRKISKAMTEPYKIGQKTNSYKEAMKQTEAGNWNLLR